MGRVLLNLAAITFAVGGAITVCLVARTAQRTAPAITLYIKHGAEEKQLSVVLPASNGYLRQDHMTFVDDGHQTSFRGTQRIVSSGNNIYTIIADYDIRQDNAQSHIHRDIPVTTSPLVVPNWTSLAKGVEAWAYLKNDEIVHY